MINPFPAAGSRPLRVVLTLLAIGVSAAAAVWLTDLSGRFAPTRLAGRHWHANGYAMLLFFAVAVPVGTALHSLPAAAGGLPVRRGWSNVARLLAYGALVAAVAWLVAPLAPDRSPSGRGDPAGLYPAWLACVLLPFAVLACAGGLFPGRRRRADPTHPTPPSARRPEAAATPEPPRRIDRALFTTGVLGWMVGGPLLALLVLIGLLGLAF